MQMQLCNKAGTVTGAVLSIAAGAKGKIEYVLLAILLAAVITFALRALPFLIFHGECRNFW